MPADLASRVARPGILPMSKRITDVIRAMDQRAEDQPSPDKQLQDRAETLRQMRNETGRRRHRGERAPLERDPATGKRPTGTGRSPTTGWRSPILKHDENAPVVQIEGRFRSRRERANELRSRMAQFSAIYNAAWLVRDAYFGPDERRRRMVKALIVTMYQALCTSDDYEAILFAVADALYASPSGVPWEP